VAGGALELGTPGCNYKERHCTMETDQGASMEGVHNLVWECPFELGFFAGTADTFILLPATAFERISEH